MWALRILSGPKAGQIYNLKPGKNRLGRGAGLDISIESQGISKEHLEIQVFTDKILISDLKSSNGTFVNGVRVQNSLIRMGDKISAHNLLFDVIASGSQTPVLVRKDLQQIPRPSRPPMPQQRERAPIPPMPRLPSLAEKIQEYNARVLLPGIYRMVEVFEFKFVVFGFAALFIFLVTLLSVIPMKQITSESTQIESRRRAQTVARALAQANEKVIRNGDLSNFSVDFVLREDGIDDVYIVSKDGTIIAPPERAGSRPQQTGFIKNIQGQTREFASEVSGDRVAAAYPIVSFDAELQQNVPRAYAVVIFNTGSLQFDDGRALSLFIQMLVIASLVGGILFFLMFKLVEYPWVALNRELDSALRESRDHVQITMKFPVLHILLVNINSLLVRALHPQSGSENEIAVNRDYEMKNLTDMMGFPALIFDKAGIVVTMNSSFEALSGMNAISLVGQNLAHLPDQALQKNIESLSQQVKGQQQQIFSDSFEMGGHPLRIHCQAFVNHKGEIDYYMVTMTPPSQAEGGAA